MTTKKPGGRRLRVVERPEAIPLGFGVVLRRPKRSLLGEVADSERAKERARELARGEPLPKPRTGRLTLEEAVDLLAGKGASGVTRDRQRRHILKAIREGKLKLPAASIAALGPTDAKRRGQRDRREQLRLRAMLIWDRDRSLSGAAVARQLAARKEFKSMDPRTIAQLIADLHPKHF